MQRFEREFRAMGSPCQVSLYCSDEALFEEAYAACVQEAKRLEHKYSRYLPDSLLSRINRGAGRDEDVELDPETRQLLHYAEVAFQQSEGLFDITSGVLRKAWDFKQKVVPEQSRIDELLNHIGWQKVQMSSAGIRLPQKGMQLDLGGVVKEYAADALVAMCRRMGVRHGLVDLAGDMGVVGPHPDGQPWRVGIRHPQHAGQAVATIPLTQGGLASSGDYARCFEIGGKRYSHLLNPKTGWPVDGLRAVSVWAPQAVVAGSVATIAMLYNQPQGLQWLQDTGLPFVAVDAQFQVYAEALPSSTGSSGTSSSPEQHSIT